MTGIPAICVGVQALAIIGNIRFEKTVVVSALLSIVMSPTDTTPDSDFDTITAIIAWAHFNVVHLCLSRHQYVELRLHQRSLRHPPLTYCYLSLTNEGRTETARGTNTDLNSCDYYKNNELTRYTIFIWHTCIFADKYLKLIYGTKERRSYNFIAVLRHN